MKIFSLANHFPSRDPRVLWSAGSLAKKGDVTVVGIAESGYEWKEQELPYIRAVILEKDVNVGLKPFIKVVSLYKVQSLLILISGLLVSPFVIPLFLPGRRRAVSILKKNLFLNRAIIALKTRNTYYSAFLFCRVVLFSLRSFTLLQRHIKTGEPVSWLANDLDTLLLANILKKYYGGTLVYDMHEFWPYAKSRENNILFHWEKRLIQQVDTFITVSPYLCDEIRFQYEIEKEFFVIPNASPNVDVVDSIPLSSFQLNKNDINFLFQGGFATERGLEILIDSWRDERIPANCKLWLRGPDNFYKDLFVNQMRIQQCANDNIRFIPAVKVEELIKEAIPFDVGVIPYEPVSLNNKYCSPNKLSQYMQAGLAILHNDLPFVSDIVSSANCGIQYSGNKESLIRAVNEFAADKHRLKEYRRNAKRYANLEYHWERYESLLFKAFDMTDPSENGRLMTITYIQPIS